MMGAWQGTNCEVRRNLFISDAKTHVGYVFRSSFISSIIIKKRHDFISRLFEDKKRALVLGSQRNGYPGKHWHNGLAASNEASFCVCRSFIARLLRLYISF